MKFLESFRTNTGLWLGFFAVSALGIVLLVTVIVLSVQLANKSESITIENVEKPSEVWYYNKNEDKRGMFDSKITAEHLCEQEGATLATDQQVYDAWFNGAEWCQLGVTNSGLTVYPMQRANAASCFGSYGVVHKQVPKYGAICYGPKPVEGTKGVYPFSSVKWSQFDTVASSN